MPRRSQGQLRPADVIGNAVHVARIATGKIENITYKQPNKVEGGRARVKARADNMPAAERSAIAKKAAVARWG